VGLNQKTINQKLYSHQTRG